MAGKGGRPVGSGSLTPQMEKFCHAYMETGNACEAYRRAYDCTNKKPSTVNKCAQQLMKSPRVKQRLDELLARLVDVYDIRVDRIIGEFARIGFSNIKDYIEFDDDGELRLALSNMTDAEAAAIAEVTIDETMVGDSRVVTKRRTKFKLHDKLSALTALGKYMQIFVNRVETDHTIRFEGSKDELIARLMSDRPDQTPLIDITPESDSKH